MAETIRKNIIVSEHQRV